MSTCQECGQPLAGAVEAQQATQTLLRVSNVAEAGYLADRLREGGYATRIAPLESFDAITGAWSMGYAILVVPETASEAAEFLHVTLAERVEDSVEDSPADTESGGEQAKGDTPGVNLWSLMTVLLAAVVGGLLFARPAQAPREEAVQQKPLSLQLLARRIERLETPLLSVAADGSKHRLTLDPERKLWLLDADRDADGRFESRETYASPK